MQYFLRTLNNNVADIVVCLVAITDGILKLYVQTVAKWYNVIVVTFCNYTICCDQPCVLVVRAPDY